MAKGNLRMALGLGLATVCACYGGVDVPGPMAGSSTGGAGDVGGDDEAGGSEGESGGDPLGPDCAAMPLLVQRLSSRQYGNAVADLLGLAEPPLFSSGGEEVEAFIPKGSPNISTPMAVELQRLAEQAASEATENVDELLACAPDLDEDACASGYLERLGSRAFRRPISTEELDGLVAVYNTGRAQDGSHRGGIELAIAAVLQSPSFLYRAESGALVADGIRVLDDYEVAAALGFFLLDSVPNEALWNAAERGDLSDVDKIREVVDTLLEEPRVQANVTAILLRWLRAREVEVVDRNDAAFTPSLAAAMSDETRRFVDNVLWARDGSLHELLTSRRSYVDAELATLYGVEHPGDGSFAEVTLPATERAGLLTQASLLASRAKAEETSIVFRGLLVAQDLLCLHYDAPPEGATDPEMSVGETEREKADYRIGTQPCATCHASFEPFGVLFEAYDELGRFRTEYTGAHGSGPVRSQSEINTPPGAAGSYDSVLDFGERLAQSEALLACTSNRVTGYAIGRALEGDDLCHRDLVYERWSEADGDLVELLRIIATSETFRYRREDEP